jgi:hypothetical protein
VTFAGSVQYGPSPDARAALRAELEDRAACPGRGARFGPFALARAGVADPGREGLYERVVGAA